MKENKAYEFKCGGEELAKVLKYYDLIHDFTTDEQKIVCPLHKDVNPSMIINLKDGSYFCFGCGSAGDALKFVKEMNPKLNDLLALKKYFEILKSKDVVKVKLDNMKSMRTKDRKYFKACWNQAHDYYYGLSSVNWRKRSDIEEIKYARKYMKARGFTPDTLNKCKAKVTYNKSYGIVFPMMDNNKFKGWVCRTMIPEVEKKRKYLYNEGFRRKTTLCGDYRIEDGPLYIVEGYMDMTKLKQLGVKNVVAILGWKMSDKQISKIKKAGFTHVISALDNDECGKKGSKYLENFFTVTRFSYLKKVKDPGEMSEEDFSRMNKRTLLKYKKDSQASRRP